MSQSIYDKNIGLTFLFLQNTISSLTQMFFKIGIPKNFAIFIGKHLCWVLFLNSCLEVLQLYWKETAVQVLSLKFAKFLRTPFFYRTLPVAASVRFLFFTKHFVRLQTGMKSFLPQLHFQKQSPKVFCKRGLQLKFAKFAEKSTTDGVSYQPATLQKKDSGMATFLWI